MNPARVLIPAERLSLDWRAPAFNTVIEFWCVPRGVKKREFNPTCNKVVRDSRLEQIP
jgi:hypothetical protein